jgi:hypothetical protein
LLRNAKNYETKTVSEEEVKALPEPVQKFMRFSNAVGKEKSAIRVF